jgi:hypothetical protein
LAKAAFKNLDRPQVAKIPAYWQKLELSPFSLDLKSVLTHRPKLIVRNVVVRPPYAEPELMLDELFQAGARIGGTLHIANTGGSRATIKRAYQRVFVYEFAGGTGGSGPLPMEPPYEGLRENANPAKSVLLPGESTIMEIRSEQPLTDTQVPLIHYAIGADQCKIYALGWIEYSDDSGTVIRRTAFCREYDPLECRFKPVKNCDYEHAE